MGLERRHVRLPQAKILDIEGMKLQSYNKRNVGSQKQGMNGRMTKKCVLKKRYGEP
jgi:hypothetical protein